MPEIEVDRRSAWSRMFGRVQQIFDKASEPVSRRLAQRFFEEVMRRQPIGKPDELVERGLSRRNVRPSGRQGNVPIEEGWMGGPVVEKSRFLETEIVLRSRSPHVEFFTMMTGRPYLGIRNSAQIARNAPFLHFWGDIGEVKTLSVKPHGFEPDTDFVADAWNASRGFASLILGATLSASLAEAVEEV